jgi:putative membrane protein
LGENRPWKDLIKQAFGEKVEVIDYDYFLLQVNFEFFISILALIAGMIIICLLEKLAAEVQIEK